VQRFILSKDKSANYGGFKVMERSGEVARVILNAVSMHCIGKHKLALFLRGSASHKIDFLEGDRGFGGLCWCNPDVIENFIEQLLEMELVRRKELPELGPFYDVLEVTDAGRKALEDKIDIPLRQERTIKEEHAGESERITLNLLSSGKCPADISHARGLALSTIYDHLFRLVKDGLANPQSFVAQERIDMIIEARKAFSERPKLREIKEKLPDDISYGEIKCVVAEMERAGEVDGSGKQDF